MTSFYAPNHLKHIAGLEKRFGPVSDEVATGLRSLVRVICQHEDPVEAIPFLERCLALEEALHGSEATLSDLNTWIGQAGGVDFEDLEPLQLRRLAVKTEVFGETSEQVAAECQALAQRYGSNVPYRKARALLERSIAIKEKLHGADSVEVAEAVDLLAETSARLEKWKDVEADLQRSLELKEEIFGARSEQVARSLLAAAIVYANASKLQQSGTRHERIRKAVSAFDSGLNLLEERFGPDSFEVQNALEAMIRAYVECREFRRAEPLLKRLLAIREKAYGNDAPALLWILTELAKGYAEESVDEAEPMLERSVAMLRMLLDAKKPIFRPGIANLPGNGDGVLEQLVRASDRFRSNLRKRWGAAG